MCVCVGVDVGVQNQTSRLSKRNVIYSQSMPLALTKSHHSITTNSIRLHRSQTPPTMPQSILGITLSVLSVLPIPSFLYNILICILYLVNRIHMELRLSKL